ncbi:MAG: nucleoside monophosphate kinase [Candidatus Parcubacteria bacterium]|nr:nucleoside monophosphate kinase [Candidatus Parcubacteria bacterium]
MNLILIGPQGSGKGTQAELIGKKFSLPTLSVGQLYRQQIRELTKIGKKAQAYVLAGKLVPDKITEGLLRQELNKKRYKKGVIFDGFPRNSEQNRFLEKLLEIDYVILIHISHKEILKRLGGRYVCDCGQTYNINSEKSERPKHKLFCDKCGHKLKQRPDDNPKAIRQRLKIYEQNTMPLFKHFKKQGKLITISGEQNVNQVFKATLLALRHKGTKV